MRISSNMLYNQNYQANNNTWTALLHTQNQLSTGKRVLTPADDPIAAARALELEQSKSVNNQFSTNIGYATDRLGLMENKLTGVTDILHYMRTKAVQAGDDALGEKELKAMGADMRAQFEQLLALANSQDGMGDYLFSGYKANTKPFTGNVGGVTYHGDDGTQSIQVSASRYMPVSLPGSDIFTKTQAVDDSLISPYNGRNNTGDASLSGTFDPASLSAAHLGKRYEITYNDDGVNPPTWDIYELQPNSDAKVAVATGLSSLNLPAVEAATGMTLNFTGTPADGDQFEVFVSSPNMFDNLGMMIDAMERPGPSGMANGAIDVALKDIDAAIDNVLKVRAQAGSQGAELKTMESVGSDLKLQYEKSISNLIDLDYVAAISTFSQQLVGLQASQASFMKVSGLTLFNYLN